MDKAVGRLDALVARVLDTYPYRFTVPTTRPEKEVAFRLRHQAALAEGWVRAEQFPDGLEHDAFDERATHIVGWDHDQPVCTGRLVFPPAALPTEHATSAIVEPRGEVADVGRMSVAPNYQSYRHAAFLALLCRLYLEMRSRDIEVACGMMSARARSLVRRLGLRLEMLGADRPYWGEQRAPVRFALTVNAKALHNEWSVEVAGGQKQGGVRAAEPE